MKRFRAVVFFGIFIAAASMLSGCAASYQARNVELKETLLINRDILKPGTGDQALYIYKNPDAKGRQYAKLMVDPVLLRRSAELDAEKLENIQKLANNAYLYLVEELRKDFQIVKSPEPGAARFQMALLDAEPSSPVQNIVTSVVPIGIGVSAIQGAATGKQAGVGEITAEFKVSDAMTGELLGAAVDRRVGGKSAGGMFDSWHNADESVKFWARQARFIICTESGRTGCVKP
ncbi:MAG: hypothetical protein H6Q84_1424 [Deltaproteobacteria bacterium]|nr:hypothetical protein [Deltaproteobacteria bacterium]